MSLVKLCSCKNRLGLIVLTLFIQGSIATETIGETTNRNKVRQKLVEGGWVEVWGVTINESDYLTVSTGIFTGNPSVISAYINNYIDRTIIKMQKNAGQIGRQALTQLITEAFRSRGRVLRNGRLEIKAGIATYNRWERIVYHEPSTRKKKIHGPFGTWTWGPPEVVMVKKERKIPLPNHHQPYVMFRYVDNTRPSAPAPVPGGQQHVQRPAPMRTISFRNASNQILHYQLDRGYKGYENFSLHPGTYVNHQVVPNAKVVNFRHDWELRPGMQLNEFGLYTNKRYKMYIVAGNIIQLQSE